MYIVQYIRMYSIVITKVTKLQAMATTTKVKKTATYVMIAICHTA